MSHFLKKAFAALVAGIKDQFRPAGHGQFFIFAGVNHFLGVAGIVALEEGPRIAARLMGMDTRQPEGIKIGTRLRVVFQDREQSSQRLATLAFEPA